MPYAVKFYLYFFITGVVAVVVSYRWMADLAWLPTIGIALAYAYAVILLGRWLFGRKL